MEEESSYFTAISKRVWTDSDKKEKELSGEVEVSEEKESLEEINGIAEPIQATNFHITDDELGQGTPKEKFRANIMAIQLLKKCEDENRNATPEEQEILSRYVGWGGLADAFDETKAASGDRISGIKDCSYTRGICCRQSFHLKCSLYAADCD